MHAATGGVNPSMVTGLANNQLKSAPINTVVYLSTLSKMDLLRFGAGFISLGMTMMLYLQYLGDIDLTMSLA